MENAESNTGGTPGVYHTDGADCPFWLVFFRSLPSPSPLRNYYEEGGGLGLGLHEKIRACASFALV